VKFRGAEQVEKRSMGKRVKAPRAERDAISDVNLIRWIGAARQREPSPELVNTTQLNIYAYKS